MSRFFGYQNVRLSAIVKHGQWRALLREPRIATLAASIHDDGQIHAPVIEKGTMKIVSGADRVAAHDCLGAEWIEVRMWQGTEAEMLAIRRAENLHRRRLSDAERLAMASEFYDTSQKSEIIGDRPPGRPKSTKRKRLADQADARGVTEDAQAKLISRVAAKLPPAESTPPPRWGVIPERGQRIAAALGAMAARLTAMQGDIKRLMHEPGEPDGALMRLSTAWTAIHTAAGIVRAASPSGPCPYCKAAAPLMPTCKACKGCGWRHAGANEDYPRELRDPDTVAHNGEYVNVASVL